MQVRELTQQFPAAVPLALVLKKFLADRSLDRSYSGGLSSYCLVGYSTLAWLVIQLISYRNPSSSEFRWNGNEIPFSIMSLVLVTK